MLLASETSCDLLPECLAFNEINQVSIVKSQIGSSWLIRRLTNNIAVFVICIFLQPSLVAAFTKYCSRRVSF